MNVLIELANIVQKVAEANSSEEQIQLLTEFICSTLSVSACYVYLINCDNNLRLVAEYGLASRYNDCSILPSNKGLTGIALAEKKIINIANAGEHPNWWTPLHRTQDPFKSFCAVPLVKSDKVVGVLIVRDTQAQQLDSEKIALLFALSAQLVLVLAESPLQNNKSISRRIRGTKGAPGVSIGRIELCIHQDLFSVENIPCADIEAALEKWRSLLYEVRADIQSEQNLLKDSLSESASGIFNAYQMLLADPMLVNTVEAGIKEGNWLPGALRHATEKFADVFLSMEDPYLRSRHEDIKALGNKLYDKWMGIESSVKNPEHNVVLVGNHVSLSSIASIANERLVGLICFDGSALSHTAIIANALGIPAVMGVGSLTDIKNGQPIVIDGDRGQIIVDPDTIIVREYTHLIEEHQRIEKNLTKELADLPAVTTDGVELELFVHMGLFKKNAVTEKIIKDSAGIGLYRTEIHYMLNDSFPSEMNQESIYRQLLQSQQGRPVYMRILDVGGDKPLPYLDVKEDNPALGWRGIRFCLDNKPLLKTQIRAMLKASEGLHNLHILLPMVSSIEEIKKFRTILEEIYQQLLVDQFNILLPPVGIMVEVPSVISQLRRWRSLIDFISIGSNDLSQYLLAIDRNNSRVSSQFDPLHPAVLAELSRIMKIANEIHLPVSLCGEMASDPETVFLLLGLGFRTLTMSGARLARIKWLIRHLSWQQSVELAQRVLEMESATQIREAVQQELKALNLEFLLTS